MKIEIIDVDHKTEANLLTLRERGFQVGDVVEAEYYPVGRICVKAIRATAEVSIGNAVVLQRGEYKVIEE